MRSFVRPKYMLTAGALTVSVGGLAAPASVAAAGYVQRVDQACAAAGAKVDRLPTTGTLKVIEQENSIVTSLVGQLKAIVPPSADAAQYKMFISDTSAQVTDINTALRAARQGNKAAAVKALKKLARDGRASNTTARKLGLAACAKNYSPKGS
jgi:hypothetical protein